MTINLTKGQKVELTKGTNLKKIKIGLGWDTNKYNGGEDFDLDASAFLVSNSGKCANENDIVFYNNLRHHSGSVIHSGDNRTGAGEGDDEVITVDIPKVPSSIDKIAITITIHEAQTRRQNFGMTSNSFVRVVDIDTNKEILRYDLGENYSTETALVACEIYRYQGEWRFSAVGSGFSGGLESLCKNYGLSV